MTEQRQQPQQQQQQDVISDVFSSVDLLREVLLHLIDHDDVSIFLSEANMLSKTFYSAIMDSDKVWKSVCMHRWSQKWGYKARLKPAMKGAPASNGKKDSKTTQGNDSTAESTSKSGNAITRNSIGQYWRNQYLFHEHDAKRDYLIPEELTSLQFDFRFWLLEYYWGQENLLQSGLRRSATSSFMFLPTRYLDDIITHNGRIKNHPSNRNDLEWFLDVEGRELQWGKAPNLWPKAKIVRLSNWGWEVRNPNVCLRAVDPDDDDSHEKLWLDLLQSIRVYKFTNFGFENCARIEVPPVYWEFRENRFRFPRIDE